MKNLISIILTVLLLLTLFTACESNSPAKAPAGVPDKGQSAPVSETGDTESDATGGEKVIHLVTDMGRFADYGGAPSSTEAAQLSLDQAMETLGGLPEGYRVEVEVLPVDDTEYQSRLTRLKTEIMSGGGPDIYYLTLKDPMYLDWVHDRLFPDPYKSMTDGYFLRLDDYMENAQFMKSEDMNPTILAAGRTSEGQMVLPLRYSFNYIRAEGVVKNTEVDWFTGIDGDDPVIAQGYAEASHQAFHNIFQDTVDYETRTLTFSEEELYHALSRVLTVGTPLGGDWNPAIFASSAVPNLPNYSGEYADNPYFNPSTKDTHTYFPMRNREGGVSACITAYVAVNRNTAYPEAAFRVVDMLMSKEFQSCAAFWKEAPTLSVSDSIAVFSMMEGVSVYDDLMTEENPILWDRYILDEMFPIYRGLRDQITSARFISMVDQILDNMKYMSWMQNMTPGDELKKYVSQEYNKMVLMAGEM